MILPVKVPPSPLPQTSDKLVILPFTDLHLPKTESQTILANREYLERADFVVLMGDMVRCYATETEYRAVHAFLLDLKRPYTAVSGNHEWYFEEFLEDSGFYEETWEEASLEHKRAALQRFKDFYRLEDLWRSFDSPLGRFVFLSLDDLKTEKQESLSAAQLEFLSTQLETDLPLFIFCHAPLLLDKWLDLIYYEPERSACIEVEGQLKARLLERKAPTFWMSGHIHLHPAHYLFEPYLAGGNVWQVHCPDSWGFGRWKREHIVPVRYQGPLSRHLEIDSKGVTFVTHDHRRKVDTASYRVDF
jgi:hypothetical protein